MMNSKTLSRIEKLETAQAEQEAQTVIFIKESFVPNVLDKPLEQWETYRKAYQGGRPVILLIDVFEEAVLRGGNFPMIPLHRFDDWIKKQPTIGNVLPLTDALKTLRDANQIEPNRTF